MSLNREALFKELEEMLEREGHLIRSCCSECAEEVLGCEQHDGMFIKGNFCAVCKYGVNAVEHQLLKQMKPLQQHVYLGGSRHFFFLVADQDLSPDNEPELWFFAPGQMRQSRYFDPSKYARERLIYKLKCRLVFG